MKVLTICEGGNVRSVTLAYVLKNRGYDAIACSWRFNNLPIIKILCEWAHTIIIADERCRNNLPEAYQNKIELADIGPDRWFQSLNPELVDICERLLTELEYHEADEAKIYKMNQFR